MRDVFPNRAIASVLYLVAVAGFAAGVWWFAFTSALDQMEERGRADLALTADRLTGQLQRYRELAVLLSDHPTLLPLVLEGSQEFARAEALLQNMADKTGSLDVELVGQNGVLAAAVRAGFQDGASGAVARAMTGALGSAHFVDTLGRRRFAYASPVFEPGGPARGAVVVSVDINAIEWNWPADPAAVFFTDAAGVVFVTNRSELVLTGKVQGSATPFPTFSERQVADHALWTIDGGRYLPTRALHLTQDLPVIGVTGEILLDLAPAYRIAALQAAVAAALCLVFGAALFVATERRRALSARLAAEAAANAMLEKRVEARTRELSEANTNLRHEVSERRDAEDALRRAQDDLVQAGKLTALGQMSAGISHELNQPLMAIQSFAENGEELLKRGNQDVATNNLSRISELARRMGRIIKNLRAFSRQESEPIGNVDLGGVVDAVLELSETRISAAGVQVGWVQPDHPVTVRGGEVRLQQVVMNLVSNAIDAMADSDDKRLDISILSGDKTALLRVRDTGPGIKEPDRIFDPFYSTKAIGKTEGMGLGLSISYGLVQSFGGAIRGRNHSGGGAEFVIELTSADLEQAA